MDSLDKAIRTSGVRKGLKKKFQAKVGVELLSYRFQHNLDLWTGEPLHVYNGNPSGIGKNGKASSQAK